jgi:hypothetical protein
MLWRLILIALLAPLQNPGPSVTGRATNTPPVPSIIGTPSCGLVNSAAGIYTVPSFTATAGTALFVGIGNAANDSAGTDFTSVTSTAGGSPSGDTFSQITFASQTFQASYGYSAFSIHGGTYVIKLASSLASGIIGVCVLQIGDVSSVVAHCTGTGATSTGACGSSITPTVSPAVAVGIDASYYHGNTYSVSSPYTIGASGAGAADGSPGSFASLYYVCLSSCTGTALTPTFTVAGTTFYNNVVGAIYQ